MIRFKVVHAASGKVIEKRETADLKEVAALRAYWSTRVSVYDPSELIVTEEDISQATDTKKLRLEALRSLKGKSLSNAEIQNVIQALIKEALGED